MAAPFAGVAVEEPVSLDFSAGGRGLLLDHGGRRLRIEGESEQRLPEIACSARWLSEQPILLVKWGQTPLFGGVLPSGTPVVGYPPESVASDGIVFSLLGDPPVHYREPPLPGVSAIAVESGALWLLGGCRAVRMRRGRGGFSVARTVVLPAEPTAACIGPDGALYVGCGSRLVRVFGEAPDPPDPLAVRLVDLARRGTRLFGLAEEGIVDLTAHVPAAEGEGPRFALPSCTE